MTNAIIDVGGTPARIHHPTLISKKEIAQRYCVTIGTVDKWMKQKRIPFFKLSSRLVRFDPADCDEHLRRFRVRARAFSHPF
jgi:excisionase family DNA binding protein